MSNAESTEKIWIHERVRERKRKKELEQRDEIKGSLSTLTTRVKSEHMSRVHVYRLSLR